MGHVVTVRHNTIGDSSTKLPLPKGTRGTVKRIDADGDASIAFEIEGTTRIQWILKKHFTVLDRMQVAS